MNLRNFVMLALLTTIVVNADAQRTCGSAQVLTNKLNSDPKFRERYQKRRTQDIQRAIESVKSKTHFKTSATPIIPVVIHYVLSTTDMANIGGAAGMQQRADSQIAVLNRDFNNQNGTTGIPAAFQPLIGNPDILFGLAHTAPDGSATAGYTVTTTTSSFGMWSYNNAKKVSTGGKEGWDPNKYLNIWVVRFSGGLLGVTTTNFEGDPAWQHGIVLNYKNFGKRVTASDDYTSGFDLGKTLTHEIGHFLDIWHPSGDDGGLCPSDPGGQDDGIADTPPSEGYSVGNPPFPLLDNCSSTFPGVMFMNYMDYCDDLSMLMFTQQQCAVMHNNVLSGGYSYQLTQHPELVQYPNKVNDIANENAVKLFPNPTTGIVEIITEHNTSLQKIIVSNMVGQTVRTINIENRQQENYTVDLTVLQKGIYNVQCIFADDIITKKIVLQ